MSDKTDSLDQKIKKTLIISFATLGVSILIDLLISLFFYNPNNGDGELIIILPVIWGLNIISLVCFIIISAIEIKDNFIGKITIPSLASLILGWILYLIPFLIFS